MKNLNKILKQFIAQLTESWSKTEDSNNEHFALLDRKKVELHDAKKRNRSKLVYDNQQQFNCTRCFIIWKIKTTVQYKNTLGNVAPKVEDGLELALPSIPECSKSDLDQGNK